MEAIVPNSGQQGQRPQGGYAYIKDANIEVVVLKKKKKKKTSSVSLFHILKTIYE